MRRLSIGGLLIGLILAIALITWQGWQRITDVLHTAGLAVFWLPVYFLLPLTCALLSWWYLFPQPLSLPAGNANQSSVSRTIPRTDLSTQALHPKRLRPSLTLSSYCLWINFAVNWLLPVAQVGGEIARVRLLLRRKFDSGVAIASIVGDQTLQILSQALYALTGILLLSMKLFQTLNSTDSSVALNPFTIAAAPTAAQTQQLLATLGFSILVLSGLSFGFYWIQKQGLFKLFSKIAHKLPKRLSKHTSHNSDDIKIQAERIDQAVLAMYHRRDRLLISILWRLGFRILAAGETWLALQFLGNPVSIPDAIILESLGQAVRSAAFLLPGGLGAQEGGMMLIGTALGIPPQLGLSVSLCKRIRELVIGVPGLVALQLEESHRLLRDPVKHKL